VGVGVVVGVNVGVGVAQYIWSHPKFVESIRHRLFSPCAVGFKHEHIQYLVAGELGGKE